jgi:hypothetical protein
MSVSGLDPTVHTHRLVETNSCMLKRQNRGEGVAERVGFEPTVRFPVRSLSRRVLSTAQSPLRRGLSIYPSRAVKGWESDRSL